MTSFIDKEITIRELLAIGVELELIVEGEKMGPKKMVELVEDHNWSLTETEQRLKKLLPREAIITVKPQGDFERAGKLLGGHSSRSAQCYCKSIRRTLAARNGAAALPRRSLPEGCRRVVGLLSAVLDRHADEEWLRRAKRDERGAEVADVRAVDCI